MAVLTIRDLLAGEAALDQFYILMAADVLLADKAGRYFGGPLTEEEVESLLPKERDHGTSPNRHR